MVFAGFFGFYLTFTGKGPEKIRVVTGTLSNSYSIGKQESEGMIVSKPFLNSKVHPGLVPSSNPPKVTDQKVIYYNPLNETVGRMEEQNLKTLGALTQINKLVNDLVELNHMESKKMDQLAKTQDILLEDHHISEKQYQTHFDTIEKNQNSFQEHQVVALNHMKELREKMVKLAKAQDILLKDHHITDKQYQAHFETIEKSQNLFQEHQVASLDSMKRITEKMAQLAKTQDVLLEDHHVSEEQYQAHFETIEKNQDLFQEHQVVALGRMKELLEWVKEGSSEVKGLKEVFSTEKLGERLNALASLIQSLQAQQDKESETLSEAASLQNLLLEEITRKQTELEKGQRKGFKGILEKLNLIKSENDKSHDTQLENQKLMVDSLYRLVNEEKAIEELKK